MTRMTITLLVAAALLAPAAARAEVPVKDRVLSPSCVSRIDLRAPEQSITNLYADPKGDYQPATMDFDLCGTGQEVFGPLNVTFRLKGSGSFRTLDGKAAFKVKMPSGNRIDGLKSFTLNNMVQDDSAVHEVLAYDAFRAVGVKAVRVGYAVVTLNGADYGLHANVETPDERFLAATFASTQHLYEAPDWQEGFSTFLSRDIVPDAVPHFQVDAGDDDSIGDLEALAAISELADDGDWWTAFQQSFDVESVLKHWATELYVGNFDGYVFDTNNYYLHSTSEGIFRFLPWGTDMSFTTDLPLDPDSGNGIVFTRCMGHPPCRAAYRDALADAAETIIALDLVNKAHQLHDTIAGAISEDSRKEMSVTEQCEAVDATIGFLIQREALWASEFRDAGSGITSSQSSARLDCSPPAPVTPVTAGPEAEPAPTKAAPVVNAGVSINDGARFTNSRRVSLSLSWPEDASGVEISNDIAFETVSSCSRVPAVRWSLQPATGRNRSRTVFARFTGGDGASGPVVSDTIVFDDVAPGVTGVAVRALARAAHSRPPGSTVRERVPYRLAVAARDSGSGVETVQVQTFRKHKIFAWPYGAPGRIELSTAARQVRLRVIDRAGNASAWRTVSMTG